MPFYRDIQDLLDIMARLRAPDGCPWDRKQTHASILNCLIEEAYEFVEAVEQGDASNMKEELGDLLLQVVFHAQMAREGGAFDFADVVQVISEKLVRRHPHVFGESMVDSAEGVQKQWDEIKQQEKAAKAATAGAGAPVPPAPEGPLGALPKHLPALLKAEKLQKRASQHGFDWPHWKGPWNKVREELDELAAEAAGAEAAGAEAAEAEALAPAAPGLGPEAAAAHAADRLEAEFGDLLFAAVNLGRFFKLDPEKALSRANRKFLDRYGKMDELAKQEGRDWKGLSLAEMDEYWERVKKTE